MKVAWSLPLLVRSSDWENGHDVSAPRFFFANSALVRGSTGCRVTDSNRTSGALRADTTPETIFLRVPHRKAEELVDLVIDAVGKVRSAKMVGAGDEEMINATAVWKFIPAFRGGRAVACQTRLTVAPLR